MYPCERGDTVSVSPPERETSLPSTTANEEVVDVSGPSEEYVPAAKPSQRRGRRKWPLVLLLAGVVIATVAGYWTWNRMVAPAKVQSIQLFTVSRRSFPVLLRERGELKAAKSIDIRSELEGRSTIISLIPEGTLAKKGDLLVELASDEIVEKIRDAEIREATARAAYEAAAKELEILQDENASNIRRAELDLRLAELALEKYREGEAVELRQDATLGKEKADYVFRRTRDTLTDSEELHKQGFLTRIELDNDRFAHYEAGLNVKKADLADEVIEKYTIPMALQEKESDVTEAQKELERTRKAAAASEAKATADLAGKKSELELVQEKLAKYRDQKEKSRIFAPSDGLVVYARSQSWFRSETLIEKGTEVHERQQRWADVVEVYGEGDDGYARVPWDNVGVQYGLRAVADGTISPEEFLDLNAQVGSWKETKDLVPEGAPFQGPNTPENFDPWSSRNMNLSPDGDTPAARAEGDRRAIRALYTSGMQFQGDIDIPIIDLRHYLEDELDMHNTQQSFATRQRMLNVDGDASNQVIWFVDARPEEQADPTPQAFAVIDQWMANIDANPELGVAGNKPAAAVDSCFATDGTPIASGPDV